MTAPLEATLALPAEAIDAIARRAAELAAESADQARSPRLTAEEAAEHLRWSKHRVYKNVGPDGIPHREHGGRLLFHRDELDQWLDHYREGWRPPPRLRVAA